MTRRKEKKLEAAEGVGGVGRNLGPEAGHGHRYPAKVGGAGCHNPHPASLKHCQISLLFLHISLKMQMQMQTNANTNTNKWKQVESMLEQRH